MKELHQPVLKAEVLAGLNLQAGDKVVDATLGMGGHAAVILENTAPTGRLLGLDLDPEAIQLARTRLHTFEDQVETAQVNFDQLQYIVSRRTFAPVQAILADLGISSRQLGRAERGFSFQKDGPLDMRLEPSARLTAAELVNTTAEIDLANLIYRYGEEGQSRRIAKAIVKARPLKTTLALAEVINRTVGLFSGPGRPRRPKIHPATRTFMALRIAVNDELGALERFLPQAIELLSPGGRLAVISFHSLEDRMVKHYFQQEAKDCLCPPTQPLCTCQHRKRLKIMTHKPIMAGDLEITCNPRARSAKLRIAQKLGPDPSQ